MIPMQEGGYPGSHLSNWRPGDDDSEELLLQKIADALRNGESERKIAKLLNVPRMRIYRAKQLAAIPEELFEELMAARVGTKAMMYIGRFAGERPPLETECCPNCGHLLRVRSEKSIR